MPDGTLIGTVDPETGSIDVQDGYDISITFITG
jgi:hypothetical protein